MASSNLIYIKAAQYRDCYEECSDLINSQTIQPGQYYDWPTKYADAWAGTDLPDAITYLLTAVNLTWTLNNSSGIRIGV